MATVLAKLPTHVADQASLLALPASQVQIGDIVIRDDNDTAYILIGTDRADFASWESITGGGGGSGDVDAEAAARAAADATLQTNITNEVNARTTAVSTEATARSNADVTLQANIDAITGVTGGLSESASVFTASFTATAGKIHRVDSSGGVIVATLPVAPADKTQVLVKLIIQGSTNGVSVVAAGSDVFDRASGPTTKTLSYVGQTITLQYRATGALWTVLSSDVPLSATDERYNGAGKNPITGYYHLGDNGGDPTATTDSTAALQALVNTVPYGSTIWLDGYFRINTTVLWKTGVSMKSAHHAAGGLRAYTVDSAPIRWNVSIDGATVGAPLTDCVFENFELDCDNETLTGGTYTVAAKGIVIQYMKRSHFRGLYVHGSHATGIGCDFLTDGSSVVGNIIVNCGRSHPTSAPNASGGGAGIGIGLRNATNEEPVTIANNYIAGNGSSTPNTSYGIFTESQTSGTSTATSGIRITGNYITGCQVGIGESGARRSVVANNQITACSAGIGVDNGTFQSNHISYDGLITGNNIYACTGPGIVFDCLTAAGKYTVLGNAISLCYQGILFKFASTVSGAAYMVSGNNIHDNKYSAIRAYYPTTGTGGITESEFSKNFIYNNGTQASAGDKDGIRFEVPLTNVHIRSNVIFDRQASKTQGYGIVLTAAATMTGGSIHGNDVRNNLTGGASFGTAVSATTWVGANAGMAPVAPASVTVTSSPMTYTAPDFPSYLFITGGTVSAVTIGGVTVRASGEGSIPLEASDSVVITYSSAPTLTFRPR